jgi:hypothetical protein
VRAVDVGSGLGSIGYVAHPRHTAAEPAPMPGSNVVTASAVMRYRGMEQPAVYAEATGGASLRHGGTPLTTAGMDLKASASPLSLVRGGLGLQIDNSSRMTLQLRKGRIGLYMRSAF